MKSQIRIRVANSPTVHAMNHKVDATLCSHPCLETLVARETLCIRHSSGPSTSKLWNKVKSLWLKMKEMILGQ